MKLNIIAPINSLSYGIVSLNLIKQLLYQGVDIAYFPIIPRNIEVENEQDLELIKNICADPLTVGNNAKNFHQNVPTLRIWHQNCHTYRVDKGKLYGMSIFELDNFSKQEEFHLSSLDHIIVNSEWAKQICVERTSKFSDEISVVPLGIDPSIFKSEGTRIKDSVCRFINIGKIEIRKGHDILLKAFELAFRPHDNVKLQLAWSNPFLKEDKVLEWENYYKSSVLSDKIEFLPRVKTQVELAQYIRNADCGVFISRGEGFNLPLLECMSMGKQVIATNYSAHTEYCTEENCLLIEVDDTEPADDGFWFDGTVGNWAKLDYSHIQQAANYMRNVYEQHQNDEDITNYSGIDQGKEFTWAQSAKKLIQVLELDT